MDSGFVERNFLQACRLDVEALKPGNVSLDRPGHGMCADDFLRSATAAAPHIAQADLRVGARVLRAARATWDAAGCNTNLGILLLCAPLAAAVHGGLRRVLDELDRQDAIDVYDALRLLSPAGLGTVPAHDVAQAPEVSLREAMASARERDRVARQYDTEFEDVLSLGVPCLKRHLACGHSEAEAMTAVYLEFLTRFPDTHVARKYGAATADGLLREARRQALDPADRDALYAWDDSLKRRGINPGTSADMAVASWFALSLERGSKTG